MRLFADACNDNPLDKIPEGVILEIRGIRLRKGSSSIYYAKVHNDKYDGWVSLGSSNYNLYEKEKRTYITPEGTYLITDDPVPMTVTSANGTLTWVTDDGTIYSF